MPINTESEQNTLSCSVFSAKQWGKEHFSSILLHAPRELVMPEVRLRQPLVEVVYKDQENPPPQQDPPVIQDPPTAVQRPPQNPPTPQANDETRGELKVFIEFEFMCSLYVYVIACSPHECFPLYMSLICYLLKSWISPVRALCIILSVNFLLC